MTQLIRRTGPAGGLSQYYKQLSRPFFEEFDHFFEEFFGNKDSILSHMKSNGSYPRLEVSTSGGKFRILAAVPGVPKENLEVKVDGDVVEISGQMSVEYKGDENSHAAIRELVKSRFARSLTLPPGVEGDPVASLKDGLLSLEWDYAVDSPSQARTIKIT